VAALLAALKRALERPGVDRLIVALSLAMLAFSLDTGLSADDYVQKLIVNGSPNLPSFARAPLDLYSFTNGAQTTALIREGVVSWWEDPEAKMSFFRPVSALTHYVDYKLWPEQAWLMHLHSLAWSALLFAGILALYRRLLAPPWIAGLAVFLYVLDDARGWLVSWVAARNAVIATALSVWALVLHVRAREGARDGEARPRGGARWLSFWAAVLFALGLLAGEGAISICAYLFAYAVWLDHGTPRARLRSLYPYAAVVLLWMTAYRSLDYGVSHSGLYFDPLREPRAFLGALIERAPVLLFAQTGGVWSDAFSVMFTFPVLQRAVVAVAAVFLVALGYLIWPIVRREPLVRFAVFGALCSVLPASATFVADRMLTWVAIGACIALARLFASYAEGPSALATNRARALLAPALVAWLVFARVIADPLMLPQRSRGNTIVRGALDRASAGVPSDPSITHKHVIYINPAGMPLAGFILIERAGEGKPRPLSQLWLATGETEVRVERVDARTLRVRQRGGFLLNPSSRLLRSLDRPFVRGAHVRVECATIEVSDLTPDGRPAEILARFDQPLEDPSYVWLQWNALGYAPFTPPAQGAHVILPAVDFVRVVLGDGLRVPVDGRMPPPSDLRWAAQ
jgi:hypothetical protein